MTEMTGLEQIIDCIGVCVNRVLEQYSEELTPDVYEDLLMCCELCNKIMFYDYFEGSEKYLSKCAELHSKPIDKLDSKIIKKWERKQRKELKEKRRDLKQLFKLIVNNLEEL